jgi:hypothetical protein
MASLRTYLDEVEPVRVEVHHVLLQVLRGPPRERRLVVRQLLDAGPRRRVRRAEYPARAQRSASRQPQRHRRRRTHRKILKIWSISESPGKRGLPRMTISAKMQPTDHMSIAVE